MYLGVSKAKAVLEDIKRIEGQVMELEGIIKQAIDDDLNSLSWARRSMWSTALDGLGYNDSLRNWKRILESVHGEMKLECGEGTEKWETWENFLGLV
jgi:hypothetical protein